MAKITRIGPTRPFRLFITEWMDKRGLNQAALAARMETSDANVSRKLSKARGMKVEDLAWFAAALDCEPEDLYRDPNMPTADELLRQAGGTPPTLRQALRVIGALKTGTDG